MPLTQSDQGTLSQLVDQETVSAVMEFFEKYEVIVGEHNSITLIYKWMFTCIQAKCCDLDSRLLALSTDKQALKLKVDALQLNADKLNPNKKLVAKETVRWGCYIPGTRWHIPTDSTHIHVHAFNDSGYPIFRWGGGGLIERHALDLTNVRDHQHTLQHYRITVKDWWHAYASMDAAC